MLLLKLQMNLVIFLKKKKTNKMTYLSYVSLKKL